MAKTLVIYYSRKGQNYVNGSIVDLPKGNTEIVAEFIQKAVGADLFEIETKKSYAIDYTQCTVEAKAELRDNARPELVEMLPSVASYNNIVVAGPCWWGTYPVAVFTQLEALDFTGKKVFPVMTHEGSGIAGAPAALKKYCHGAVIGEGMAITGGAVAGSEEKVAAWAKKNLA